MKELVEEEEKLLACKGNMPSDEMLTSAKKDGFSDKYLSQLLEIPEEDIRNKRISIGVEEECRTVAEYRKSVVSEATVKRERVRDVCVAVSLAASRCAEHDLGVETAVISDINRNNGNTRAVIGYRRSYDLAVLCIAVDKSEVLVVKQDTPGTVIVSGYQKIAAVGTDARTVYPVLDCVGVHFGIWAVKLVALSAVFIDKKISAGADGDRILQAMALVCRSYACGGINRNICIAANGKTAAKQ